ncbi:unnamed protein product [Arctogadus glacialis]
MSKGPPPSTPQDFCAGGRYGPETPGLKRGPTPALKEGVVFRWNDLPCTMVASSVCGCFFLVSLTLQYTFNRHNRTRSFPH